MFRTKNTDFSFDHNKGVGAPGNNPVYNTYGFTLGNYKGRTVVDLYLTLPLAMARIGGFIFGLLVIAWLFLWGWNYFNTNSELIQMLYHFTPSSQARGADPKQTAATIVRDKRAFDYGFFSWIFFCLCNEKRQLWKQARDSLDKELDIINLVNSTRKANFLAKLERNPAHVALCKYSADYRVETNEGCLTERDPNADEVAVSRELNPDDHLDAVLIAQITGSAVSTTG